MTSDLNQQLLETVAQLTARINKLEAEKNVKKAARRHGLPPKAYEGHSGDYFEFVKQDDCNTYQLVKDQLNMCLENSNFLQDITKNNLGRAILSHYRKTGDMIFWAPNKTTLIFGHARSGVSEADTISKFNIPLENLTILGSYIGDKQGKIQVERIVQFEQFMQEEIFEKQQQKYQKEMELLKQKTTKKK